MTSIKDNLADIRQKITLAAERGGREADRIKLVAVSKRKPAAQIQEAIDAGQMLFGENYVQEAQEKIPLLPESTSWHFIGHLQSNKAKIVAELFDVVETIDSQKLADVLEKHLATHDRKMEGLIQVNIGLEKQKSGVMPEDVEPLLLHANKLEHLRIVGLMAMPPYMSDAEAVRPYFAKMRVLADQLEKKGLLGQQTKTELSMGMSGDFETAIEEGATIVRVGTAIFGTRN